MLEEALADAMRSGGGARESIPNSRRSEVSQSVVVRTCAAILVAYVEDT